MEILTFTLLIVERVKVDDSYSKNQNIILECALSSCITKKMELVITNPYRYLFRNNPGRLYRV